MGQGSSRDNAGLAPRHRGVRLVVARSFARIHWQNLVNFGVLPLTFEDPGDADKLKAGDIVVLTALHAQLREGGPVSATLVGDDHRLGLRHQLSHRQIDVLITGGLIPWQRQQHPH